MQRNAKDLVPYIGIAQIEELSVCIEQICVLKVVSKT